VIGDRALVAALVVAGCRGAAGPALDTTCPVSGPTAEVLLAEIGERGIQGPPESVHLALGGSEVLVGWKNLLSGRALTLSCAYRREGAAWRLVRHRLDEGTHTLQLSTRDRPPAVIYRDAQGTLLEELPIGPS
jgi:hypothetical protein